MGSKIWHYFAILIDVNILSPVTIIHLILIEFNNSINYLESSLKWFTNIKVPRYYNPFSIYFLSSLTSLISLYPNDINLYPSY